MVATHLPEHDDGLRCTLHEHGHAHNQPRDEDHTEHCTWGSNESFKERKGLGVCDAPSGETA